MSKHILFTTEYKGIFCGIVSDDFDLTAKTFCNVDRCRMVIRHRTGKGVQGIAQQGPTKDCLLSAETHCPVMHGVTAVFSITPEAAEKIWPTT